MHDSERDLRDRQSLTRRAVDKKQTNTRITASAVEMTYSRVNRMLGAPREMDLTVVHPHDRHNVSAPAPGWTDGKDIFINGGVPQLLPAFEAAQLGAQEVMLLSGLNYHELSHCFYTPPLNGQLATEVREAGHWQAFNILEDQKVESLFVSKYAPSRNYFIKLSEVLLRGRPEQNEANYALIAGRLFLPTDLRKWFKDQFKFPEHASEIEDIALAYRVEQDDKEMFDLISRLSLILNDMAQQRGQSLTAPDHAYGNSSGGPQRCPQPLPDMEEDGDDEVLGSPAGSGGGSKSEKESESEEEPAAGGSGEASEDAEEGDEGASGGEASGEDAESAESEEGGNGEGGAETENSSKVKGASGESGSPGESQSPDKNANSTLEDILKDAIEEAAKQSAGDVRRQQRAIRENEKQYRLTKEKESPRVSEAPTSGDRRVVDRIVREFRTLERRHRPGWHSKRTSGRIDPSRVHRVRDYEFDVFKKWDEGKNKLFAYEVTILLDKSGSMSGEDMNNASRSTWHLRKAFHELKAKTTLIGYSGDARLLADRTDRPEAYIPLYHSYGGTNATPALQAAMSYHQSSTLKKHICFIITDGYFNDAGEAVEMMSNFGYPIVLIGIGEAAKGSVEGFQQQNIPWLYEARSISHPLELAEVIKDFVLKDAERSVS